MVEQSNEGLVTRVLHNLAFASLDSPGFREALRLYRMVDVILTALGRGPSGKDATFYERAGEILRKRFGHDVDVRPVRIDVQDLIAGGRLPAHTQAFAVDGIRAGDQCRVTLVVPLANTIPLLGQRAIKDLLSGHPQLAVVALSAMEN